MEPCLLCPALTNEAHRNYHGDRGTKWKYRPVNAQSRLCNLTMKFNGDWGFLPAFLAFTVRFQHPYQWEDASDSSLSDVVKHTHQSWKWVGWQNNSCLVEEEFSSCLECSVWSSTHILTALLHIKVTHFSQETENESVCQELYLMSGECWSWPVPLCC